MKPGSEGSKKPKLYEVDVPLVGSVTTIASWPKRSQNSSPGAIVITSMRGAAMFGAVTVASGAAAAGVDPAHSEAAKAGAVALGRAAAKAGVESACANACAAP